MFKRFVIIINSVSILFCLYVTASDIVVRFSPKGGVTKLVVDTLKETKSDIMIQAYGFTNKDILDQLKTLLDAKIKIRVILDASNLDPRYTGKLDELLDKGCEIYIDSKHSIAHNKIMLIDSSILITGSFNFTQAAETSNAENLLVIKNEKELVTEYILNWNAHILHSVKYVKGMVPTKKSFLSGIFGSSSKEHDVKSDDK